MKKTDYRKALKAARLEFDKLLEQRLLLEKRIVHLRQTISGLRALCEDREKGSTAGVNESLFPRPASLTGSIRQVLSKADSPMSPLEVRDALTRRGRNLSQYANQLSVIHNTLRRLQRQGQAIQVSGAWLLTDKGKLASEMDLIDVHSPVQSES